MAAGNSYDGRGELVRNGIDGTTIDKRIEVEVDAIGYRGRRIVTGGVTARRTPRGAVERSSPPALCQQEVAGSIPAGSIPAASFAGWWRRRGGATPAATYLRRAATA